MRLAPTGVMGRFIRSLRLRRTPHLGKRLRDPAPRSGGQTNPYRRWSEVDDQTVRKPLFTPLEPASDAGFRGRNEQRPPKPLVGGSIPSGPASLIPRL